MRDQFGKFAVIAQLKDVADAMHLREQRRFALRHLVATPEPPRTERVLQREDEVPDPITGPRGNGNAARKFFKINLYQIPAGSASILLKTTSVCLP